MKFLILFLVLGVGCGTPASIVKALSKDPATASVQINSMYGTIRYLRIVPKEGSTITISPDGSATVRQAGEQETGNTTVIMPSGKVTTIIP